MVDFPNKIVTIVIVFVMLVISPLTNSYIRGEMVTERVALNEIALFLDRVTDKGSITEQDLDDLYIGVNSSGGTYDVQVKRYIRMATEDGAGATRTLYLNADIDGSMNTGDIVSVSLEEIGISPAKRLLWAILKVDSGDGELGLARTVR